MSTYVIGFTNKYYTLWNIGEPYREYVSQWDFYMKQDAAYLQNLSLDFEAAKEKAKSIVGDFDIDLELRGQSTFYGYITSEKRTDLKPHQFPYGKLVGEDIRDCEDVWQLKRLYNDNSYPRSQVYARRRLIELGELVKYRHIVNVTQNILWGKKTKYAYWLPFKAFDVYDHERIEILTGIYDKDKYRNIFLVDGIDAYEYYKNEWGKLFEADEWRITGGKYVNYTTPDHVERIEASKERAKVKSGYWFNDGDKKELELKLIEEFDFKSPWGWTTVQKFVDANDRQFTYIGSSPKNFEIGEMVKIKATIKHQEYNEEPQTKLLRIKVA